MYFIVKYIIANLCSATMNDSAWNDFVWQYSALAQRLQVIVLIGIVVIIVIFRIKSVRLAGYVLALCGVYVIYGWFYQSTRGKADESDQCLALGSKKDFGGVFAGGCLDLWHASHLFFWMVLGLLAPGYWEYAFAISVFWEVIEQVWAVFGKGRSAWKVHIRFEDLVINMFGYGLGNWIASMRSM